jgi:predicted MFS family arabinose efflux permease
VRFRLIVLALGTFAIGTGSFIFAGPQSSRRRRSQ